MPKKLSIPPDELRAYILRWAGKKSSYEMHKETGVYKLTIVNYASDMGVSLEVEEKVAKHNKLKQTILELHETHSTREISDMLEIPKATVAYRGWVMGVKFKRDDPTVVPAIVEVKQRFFNPYLHKNWLM